MQLEWLFGCNRRLRVDNSDHQRSNVRIPSRGLRRVRSHNCHNIPNDLAHRNVDYHPDHNAGARAGHVFRTRRLHVLGRGRRRRRLQPAGAVRRRTVGRLHGCTRRRPAPIRHAMHFDCRNAHAACWNFKVHAISVGSQQHACSVSPRQRRLGHVQSSRGVSGRRRLHRHRRQL